jgi:hypothetical protein
METLFTKSIINKYLNNESRLLSLFDSCYYNIFNKKTHIDKIKCIHNIMYSKTITKEEKYKAKILLKYYNKYNNAITKFQKRFKIKYIYKDFDYKFDINMNELSGYDDTKKHILIQNKTIYVFYIYDLLKIIKTSLLNSQNLYEQPKKAKNPYTNLLLSDTQLYNIYIFCRMNDINIDYFTKQYYKVNLDIVSFKIENSEKLFENAINNYLYYSDNEILYQDIFDMIYEINRNNIHNQSIEEQIKLINPEEATTNYKERIVKLCKNMLFPYFIILYKCGNNQEMYSYYINKVINYIISLQKNYKYFWRVKVIAKRIIDV